MVSIITFIIMAIGSLNWLCIGVLQYDFIAGLFGSQANVFSRIIYAIIGISAFFVCFALIKGKGKLKLDKKIKKPKLDITGNDNKNEQPSQQNQPSQPNQPNYNPNQYPNQQQPYVQPYYAPPPMHNQVPNQAPVPNQTLTGFNADNNDTK